MGLLDTIKGAIGLGGEGEQVDAERIRKLQSQLGSGTARIQGDIRNLDFGITDQDKQQVEDSIGATSDMARSNLEKALPGILAQISGQTGARGLAGSSIEANNRAGAGAQALQGLQEILAREQSQGAMSLLQIPGQRADRQLGKQRLLFDNLVGSITPQLNSENNILKQQTALDQAEKDSQSSFLGKLGGLAGAGIGFAFGGPAGASAGASIGGGFGNFGSSDTGSA